MYKYTELRNKHKIFSYHSYEIGEDYFRFHFSLADNNGDIHFYPMWKFDKNLLAHCADFETLKYAVFNLGMVELVSYWKCALSPEIRVLCGSLDEFQVAWWKKLYINGLGEFFYRNRINSDDYNDLFDILPQNPNSRHFNNTAEANGALIPVGGGKDSIVTMEILKNSIKDNKCYIINPRPPVVATAVAAGYQDEDIIGVRRTIDKELLRLNELGYLNGHTPFSAVVAFSGWIFAYLSGKKYIVLSNESSANEVNVAGTVINHQYSKSTEFERDFREYTEKIFGAYPEYFSLLRPLSEWQITKKFASYPKYLGIFQSCNVGSKTDTWCGKCAKCLYVYIMLAAFLPDVKLIGVFGSNMLDNKEFEQLFNSLIYPDLEKPFECVGTRDEICLALFGAYQSRKNNMPYLLRLFFNSNPVKPDDLSDYFDENNFVPKEFLCLIE